LRHRAPVRHHGRGARAGKRRGPRRPGQPPDRPGHPPATPVGPRASCYGNRPGGGTPSIRRYWPEPAGQPRAGEPPDASRCRPHMATTLDDHNLNTARRGVGPMPIEESLEQLQALKERARLGGGVERIEAQHERGKLTARERIDALLDPGTFEEIDALAHDWEDDGIRYYGDAVVTGWGKMDGRTVCVYAQDFTVFGGS